MSVLYKMRQKKAVYWKPKNPLSPQEPNDPQDGSSALDKVWNAVKGTWDVVRAIPGGARQGLSGRNLTFEQWQRENNRRKRGNPRKDPRSWLQKLID